MDSLKRLQRLFRIGIVVAAVMLAGAATLIILRETQFDRLQEEYAAAREAATLLEQYVETGTLPTLPAAVAGFGIYDGTGEAIVTAGTAPASIRPPGAGDVLTRTERKLRLIRPIGTGRLPSQPTPGAHGQRPMMPPDPSQLPEMPQRGLRRMPGFGSQFVLLDYNLSYPERGQAWERAALIGSGILTAAVLGIVVVLYRKLQQAHRQAEDQRRLAQLGEAARTLAHEIKNPLTAAQMQSALLRRSVGQDQHHRVDVLDEELRRIRTLTDQIREFLKNGSGSPEHIVVLPAVREIARRLSIDVSARGDERTAVLFDRDRFTSVMGNLLRNAREADEGGTPIEVDVDARRGRVVVSVADRGSGLAPGDRERVFDPFYTTKTRGSGVGLAITRRFVEDAGGKITIEDREGGGTVVVLTLRGSTT